jgi:archaellum component FlaC
MPELRIAPSPAHPARMKLEPYSATIRLEHLIVGLDNIHYDVFLSPKFVEFSRKYLLDLVRQAVNIAAFYGKDRKATKAPEHAAFRKLLTEILQESVTRAKFRQSIETDVLHRLALLKYLMSELSSQFSSLLVECKDWIRGRGELFEHSEQAHVMRSKISEMQADRKKAIREAGDTLCRIWREVEEGTLAKSRRALFGEDFHDTYDVLQNRLLFVENGNDDHLFLEHYVLLGNFMQDPDRFDVFDTTLLDFVRDFVLSSDNSEGVGKARKSYERLLEQARSLRSELERIDEELKEFAGRGDDSGDSFTRLFKRRPAISAEAHGEAADMKRKYESLERNLEELGPEVEAAKQRLDFLTEEHRNRVGDYLNEPSNARRIFDARSSFSSGSSSGTPDSDSDTEGQAPAETRAQLLVEWVHRLEERDLLFHVLAGYELRKLSSEYCPPVHLQQLKKALVNRDEVKRVEHILEQFPARKISTKRLDDASRSIRRRSQEETLSVGLQFAEDFMRLRRDRRNYQQVAAWLERINLVRDERARELSRANKSLYEFLHPEEGRPEEDPVVSHAVIKADVRGSTSITRDLLARNLNPASFISMNLHEPVKRILERFGAAKVFIEGDAIILAIYEHESTRATHRAVARACILGREILAVTQAYNSRAVSSNLPALELGVGVAFQDSAPSLWMDNDSHIMISRALNLSDRLSSCSKMAKRLFAKNPSPFNVYLLQTLMEDAVEDEGEELLVRYNLNGIELNEEGFQKLTAEISLAPMSGNFPLPWGKERVQLYFGEVPLGESLEPIVVRKGFVRQLLPGGKIGAQGARPYYEVCTDPKLLDLARKKASASAAKSAAAALD